MWRLHFVYVAFSTVVKLIGAVIPGTVISHYLIEPLNSEQGFSFITLKVFLSCMLFANLCKDVSIALLQAYFWAVLLSLIPMVLGILSSLLVRKLVPNEWRVLLVLGSTFQNGLAFPLSVVSNIQGVAWMDIKSIAICQQYVFLYNLTCAVGLWSIGSLMVKHYKDKLIEKHQDVLEDQYFEELNQKAAGSFQMGENEAGVALTSHTEARSQVRSASPLRTPANEGSSAVRGRLSISTLPMGNTARDLVRIHTDTFSFSSSASPTVVMSSPQRSLDWYRPSRRHAYPIDLRKYKKYVENGEMTPGALKEANKQKKEEKAHSSTAASAGMHSIAMGYASGEVAHSGRQRTFSSSSDFSSSSSSCSESSSPESPADFRISKGSATNIYQSAEDPHILSRAPASSAASSSSIPEQPARDLKARQSESGETLTSPLRTTVEALRGSSGGPTEMFPLPSGGRDSVVVEAANVVLPDTADLELRFRDRPFSYRLHHVWEMVKFVLLTPPLTLSIIGIAVALIPPLHWLGSTALGAAIIQGFEVIGAGCVPVQLLTLGIILSPNNLKVDTNVVPKPGMSDPGGEEEERRETEARDWRAAQSTHKLIILVKPFRWLRRRWQRIPPAVRLSILCLTLRLLILPACAFFVVHSLLVTGVMPSDKPFVVSILIGVSSPAAVNASLVCTMHGYYPRQFAKMILTMYCVAAITSTFWISVSITYANHMD